MFLPALLCSVIYLVLVRAESDAFVRPLDFRYVFSDRPVDIKKSCNNTCITKCCAANQIIFSEKCVDISSLKHQYNYVTGYDDYSGIIIYDKNIKQNVVKTNKIMANFIGIYSSDMLDRSINLEYFFQPPTYQFYILEDGRFMVRRANYREQWFINLGIGDFCVENELVVDADGIAKVMLKNRVVFSQLIESDIGSSYYHINTITAYAMLVSSFFLLLVLVVYALLPQQNLANMTLMAYVVTLTTGFIFRAAMVIGTNSQQLNLTACQVLSFFMYYGIIGSFTWLNVLSFDIWSSLRGRGRSLRRSMFAKFSWYCAYGWGAPLVPVVFMLIVEHIDLTHLPDFVKPQLLYTVNCYMEEDERQLYIEVPIIITTSINIVLFLMTAYSIWRFKTSDGGNARSMKNKVRFCIYLKLSLVMGVFWILEALSSHILKGSWLWYINSIFNSSIGLFIFIIFVCKRNILVLLCIRFSIDNKFVRTQIQKLQPEEPTTSSDGAVDMDTLS